MHAIGLLRQLAYVVPDLEDAALDWTRAYGAGPWFRLPGFSCDNWTYRGSPQELVLDILIGQLDQQMIELIAPRDRSPSVYYEKGDLPVRRAHHYGLFVPDFDAALDRLNAGPPITSATTVGGTRLAYCDTRSTSGLLTELIEDTEETRYMRRVCEDAAAGWTGDRPIRELTA